MVITGAIWDKLLLFTKEKVEHIRNFAVELSIYQQIALGGCLSVLILFVSSLFLDSFRWIGIFLGVFTAYLIVEFMSKTGQKRSINETLSNSLVSRTPTKDASVFILTFDSKPTWFLQVNSKKTKYSISPFISFGILSASQKSLCSSLSDATLSKLSSFKCNVTDLESLEVLTLFGKTLTCTTKDLHKTLLEAKKSSFIELESMSKGIKKEARIGQKILDLVLLQQMFPLYSIIKEDKFFSKKQQIELESPKSEDNGEKTSHLELNLNAFKDKDSNSEISTALEELIKNPFSISDAEQEQEKNTLQHTFSYNFCPIKRERIEQTLLNDLNFSFEKFASTAKIYVKKTIEEFLQQEYENMDYNQFISTLKIYCDKEGLDFFYPSYDIICKWVEFSEIELPNSNDVRRFISHYSKELSSDSILTANINDLKHHLNNYELDNPTTTSGNKSVKEYSIPKSKVISFPSKRSVHVSNSEVV